MLRYTEKIMLGFIAAFFSHLWWQSLPSIYVIGLSVFVSLVLITKVKLPFINGILLGFMWAGCVGHYYLHWQMPISMFDQNVLIKARVISIHDSLRLNHTQNGIKMERALKKNSGYQPHKTNSNLHLEPQKIDLQIVMAGTHKLIFRPHVRLSWYQPEFVLQQGDEVLLLATLTSPSGLANPDGFNYQKWLTSSNIVATGYIQQSPSNQILVPQSSFRQEVVNQISHMRLINTAEILALTIGYRKRLSSHTWQLIQQTGTAHLFAISGLHLGIVFGMSFVFCRLFIGAGFILSRKLSGIFNGIAMNGPWSQSRIAPYNQTQLFCEGIFQRNYQVNTLPVCLIISSIFAAGYAYISGFEVPVTRAILSLGLVSLLTIFSVYWRLGSIVLLLLTVFIVVSPLSLLSLSFWFSFSAISFIWFCLWRMNQGKTQWKHKVGIVIKLQCALCVLMIPVVAYSFHFVSLSSAMINLIAVPIVTLFVVPLCAIGLLLLLSGFYALSEWVLSWADMIIYYSLQGLSYVVSNNVAGIEIIAIPLSVACLALLSVLIFFMPYWPYKGIVCFLLIMPLVSYFMPTDKKGWEVDVMDVGHGLAVVIQNKHQYLIYDTGASFQTGSSVAQAILLPYFKAKQVKHIAHLIVSHSDNDHSGGAKTLLNNLIINRFHSPANSCNKANKHLNQSQFEDLFVEIFWPLITTKDADNNQSCVIKLTHTSSNISILLTGDIEASTEAKLVELHRQKHIDLSADILLAPHHGSKTSSSIMFVKSVKAKHVVFSTKYRHRWGFPADEVKTRFANTRALLYNTGTDGRIKFSIDDDIIASRYRRDEFNRWYFKP